MDKEKVDIINRLRRIEGQINGICKMIEEDKKCIDVLTQVSAVKSAVNNVGVLIIEKYTDKCLLEHGEEKEKNIEELLLLMKRFLKHLQ